jgi:endonuclease/exonuclease/phosphatase family metal-dependent hydrolase
VLRRVALTLLLAVCLAGATACDSDAHDDAAPAGTTTTSSSPARPPLRIVTMNVLHGALCDDGPRHCGVRERMRLLAREIERSGCPEVVALQEIAPWWRTWLFERAKTLCDGDYHVVSPPVGTFTFDAQTVLSKLPTSDVRRFDLAPRISQRRALRLTVDSPKGPIVLVVTHTGTNADDFGAGGVGCAETQDCPPPCDASGPAFDCQILQLRNLATGGHDDRVATIIAGDLNLVPTAPLLRTLTDAGFVDTYRAAGLPECNPATGAGCTGGREDEHVATLRDRTARQTARIDHIFLLPTEECRPRYGAATGLFGDEPAAGGPDDFAWISDHTGVELELSCA